MGVKILTDRQLATNSATQDKEVKINKKAAFDNESINNVPDTVVKDKEELKKEQEQLKENVVDANKTEMEKKEDSDKNDDDADLGFEKNVTTTEAFGDMTPIYTSTSGKTTDELLNAEPLPIQEDSMYEDVKDSNYGDYTGGGDDIYTNQEESQLEKYNTGNITSYNGESNGSGGVGSSGTNIYKNATGKQTFIHFPGTAQGEADFLKWLKAEPATRKVLEIQQHCTAGSTKGYKGDPEAQMRSMEAFHTGPKPNGRGWSHIAQNFSTFPDGTISVGVTLDVRPIGIISRNSYGICIENKGNFVQGDNTDGLKNSQSNPNKNGVKPPQERAILLLTAALCLKYGLDPAKNTLRTGAPGNYGDAEINQGCSATIVYHAWFNKDNGKFQNPNGAGYKECPGSTFFNNGQADFGFKMINCQRYFIPKVVSAYNALKLIWNSGIHWSK